MMSRSLFGLRRNARLGTTSRPPARTASAVSAISGRALSFSGSFHFDVHAHPRMDTAFEMMRAFRQTSDLDLAALEESSPGHCDPGKASGTFGDRFLSRVELWYEASAEISYLSKGVRLAALVDYADNGSFLDFQRVWLEIPVGVRSSSRCLSKQVRECGGCSKGDVLAEVRPQHRVKSGRIAFIQGYDLCNPRSVIVPPRVAVRLPLRQR